ncbi:Novel Sm-like protein with long N-and C-terminal domains [Ectocarpus siliculosus]|uniref:Novel Sm-like protein with long N-and C-terminal domains n=1 Tax=Ectocarpus siliculosus TaxID=2880 RepID=D7FK17_ECTSI|nr:Novel Sm-like protein with long N-and C-terminal domains [Ectocarpus siliculosus]|eukprot:CBJ49106.1 Novel Sm-like protein with long N-and C-terminal domains [Ectocarpus siliculosus]
MSGDLVGSRISLISRKDIRWEGILVQVDRENASVTLQNVKSWGTEGRLEGDQQIPPSDHLHACVNFRGEDIKDLHVHETAEAPAPPPAAPVQPPPPPALPVAPVATRVAPDVAAGGGAGGVRAAAENGDVEAEDAPGSSTMRDQGLKPGRYQPPHKNPNWKPPPTVQRGPPGPGSGAGSGTGALPGQGNHLLNRRTRGGGGGPSEAEGEFDFEAGLAKFDKEKSSFFDEISCDALDGRGHMPGGRGGERTRNTETFGATSVALSAGSRRYGGRGGGGGGYSSYMGGRRGGYNDRNGGGGDSSYRGQYPQGGGRGGNRQESGGSWRRN